MIEPRNDEAMAVLETKVDGLAELMGEQWEAMRDRRKESLELRKEMKAGFERVEEKFERMQRMMILGAVGMSSSFIAGFAAVIGVVATQL